MAIQMQMEEENWDFSRLFQPFPDATKTNSAFCRLNLQTTQALKGKSNPNQAYPKCNCTSSSSITQQKILHTYPSNIQLSGQILHHLMLKTLQLQLQPKLHKYPKNKYID
jgi:hypothetical protein